MTALRLPSLPKSKTGITGLDEITEGGLPSGRPTLICGSAGCGKTILGIQFLVNGITKFDEPGVLMTFEENPSDLAANVKSLGYDLDELVKNKKLKIDHVQINPSEIDETGEYDLEALFIRLNHAIDSIGAKRVVLDTIESIFLGNFNPGILRAEIRRLFTWLKEKGVTAIITGEQGEKVLTRQGLEEYVSDCVILLDFRVLNQIATRRLRIVKYRGSTHGTNEYPFLIDDHGISVLPITSLKLDHKSSDEIISSGLSQLDKFFQKGGLYRGSTTLVTGTAGSAKTILAGAFAESRCENGEKVLYFSFEESPVQLIRNLKNVGINLDKYINTGHLRVIASRPTFHGLEMHLLMLFKLINNESIRTVIIDPISSLITIGTDSDVKSMLVRLMDMLKHNNINAYLTSLSHNSAQNELSLDTISSLADTWIKLENENRNGNTIRSLQIIKARGMGHQNQRINFSITDNGIQINNTN